MNIQQQELLKRITIKSGLMGGKPTVRGLRFPVGDILELLSGGLSEDEILSQHPILEKEDIHAALLYASFKVKKYGRNSCSMNGRYGLIQTSLRQLPSG